VSMLMMIVYDARDHGPWPLPYRWRSAL